ncbi:hypothetical protein [Aliarcobacter lanthieri]|uniref:hypothetical protein n=1 Tax=Aliarcobacter lanthieri TaxID=1355374 RepID=UPI003AB00AD8
MKKYLFISIILFIFSGCTNTNNNLTIQEQIELNKNSEKSKTHLFENRTKIEVLEALKKVLLYSDGDDFKVTYFEDKVIIKRFTFIYYVFGFENTIYNIEIKVQEKDNNIIFTSSASASTGGIPAGVTINIESPLFYDFLYNRIEYVLNMDNPRNPYKWVTCDEEIEKIAKKYTRVQAAELAPLCSLANDSTPEEYIKKHDK